ncbi:MAG: toll/interleukin-1 receptor domain-containing protein [Pirellulales bacterium]
MAKGRKKYTTAASDASSQEYLVFVSHATADKWIAKIICERLEQAGVATFRDDRDIDGGDDIPETIKRGITKCRELVVLLSPRSVHRPWVLLEVGAAWGRGKKVIAIRHHVEVDLIPEMIKSKKAIDLNDIEDYITEVSKRASRRVR